MKEYVPIFFDWVEVTGELNAQEKGRLIDAIVLYAQGGDWQEQIKGNERYLFPAFRKQIDRGNEISEARAEAGRAGRQQQTGTNHNKPEQNQTNLNKPQQTGTNGTNPNEEEDNNNNNKEEEKEENKESDKRTRAHEQLAMFDRFWAAYPRKTAKKDAVKAWGKIGADEKLLAVILAAIEKQKAGRQWSDPEYIPHPATWLNGRRWEDEVAPGSSRAAKRSAQTDYKQREYEERKPDEVPEWLENMLKEEAGA